MATSAADLERAQRYLTTLSEHVRKLAGRVLGLGVTSLLRHLAIVVLSVSIVVVAVRFPCSDELWPRLPRHPDWKNEY